MIRTGMNWKVWLGLSALVLSGLGVAMTAAPAHGPACTDLSAVAADTRPGFISLAPRPAPACLRIALR